MSRALIVGITGQDGSYLAELLLQKGYEVHGLVRRASTNNRERLNNFSEKLVLHYGDLADSLSLTRALANSQPDEVYNLGAMSDVRVSFDDPEYAADVTGTGTIRLLEAIRGLGLNCRYYQASSSEMFGSSPPPQSETTLFHPRSPYGCAKVFSYWATVNYREAYGMHASNGILFNHESRRRGDNFVTKKIVKAAARIDRGEQDVLYLGNLDARRDWGYAGDYVEAMWRMLQQPSPDDYVIATGESHSVREFLEETFGYLDLDIGKYVRIDSNLFRPSEVEYLLGDPSKAKRQLGWEPKVSFEALVRMMVDAEYE
jgi:GDPmannose 4,6-dehydratase